MELSIWARSPRPTTLIGRFSAGRTAADPNVPLLVESAGLPSFRARILYWQSGGAPGGRIGPEPLKPLGSEERTLSVFRGNNFSFFARALAFSGLGEFFIIFNTLVVFYALALVFFVRWIQTDLPDAERLPKLVAIYSRLGCLEQLALGYPTGCPPCSSTSLVWLAWPAVVVRLAD